MITYSDINPDKKAVIFELDNVLIPKKDYDLQVYYLFANFIEYLETFPPAHDVIDFIKKRYEIHGNTGLFEELVKTFGINVKYQENLKLLFTNAKLPLKLLLYKEVLTLLQEITIDRKQLFILTSGDPKEQLNKITQTEWNGLDKYLKVYFVNEFAEKPDPAGLNFLLQENDLLPNDVIYIALSTEDRAFATAAQVDFLSIKS